jgi:hypothetical protein
MTSLKERLFWMDFNNMGLDETGFLMTMEQLLSELPDVYDNKNGTWKKRRPSKEDIEEWLDSPEDIYVNNKFCKGFTGEYRGNITFTVKEVESLEELRDLMTWKDFDYENGYTAVELDRVYPDFVPDELRLSMCIYGETPGWTSTILPGSGDENPTVAKYMKELGLSRDELFHKYSDTELAAIEISQALQDNDLTKEEFDGIVDSYNLSLHSDINNNMGKEAEEDFQK